MAINDYKQKWPLMGKVTRKQPFANHMGLILKAV